MRKPTAGQVFWATFNFIVGREKKKHQHGDPTREVFETVVFVAILVLMLKLFVAEAFVIPTGSMASTLWGDQVRCECPECEYKFAVTASSRHGKDRQRPSATYCQNCGARFTVKEPDDYSSGDRVLVGKYAYHLRPPQRFDVPVFKYPERPYDDNEKTAMNFIKRLVGLPGETVAIDNGDLYVTTELTYPGRPRPENPDDLWMGDPIKNDKGADYRYVNDPEAVNLFNAGGFGIVRKSPKEILAMRRLVFDLDRQPKGLTGIEKTRWQLMPSDAAGWSMEPAGFNHTGSPLGWVRYQHVQAGSWNHDPYAKKPASAVQPSYIVDFLSYNQTGNREVRRLEDGTVDPRDAGDPLGFWVPDLIVECEASLGGDDDRLILELNKGADKFQAHFGGGKCRVFRIASATPDKPALLAEADVALSGKRELRFANVDCRLTVWVDDDVVDLGAGADYKSEPSTRPTTADLHEPVRVGATGAVVVEHVKLWRDIYYTCMSQAGTENRLYQCGLQTYYVHPGHYLCLGDNSSESDDGRRWGLVPDRLMLGRAVTVYWPIRRIGVIK